ERVGDGDVDDVAGGEGEGVGDGGLNRLAEVAERGHLDVHVAGQRAAGQRGLTGGRWALGQDGCDGRRGQRVDATTEHEVLFAHLVGVDEVAGDQRGEVLELTAGELRRPGEVVAVAPQRVGQVDDRG